MQYNLLAIDVSSTELVTKLKRHSGQTQSRTFANTSKGHQQLIAWASNDQTFVRACLEATGCYSWEIALALSQHQQCEVMMINPRASKHFAQALMQRAKTDRVDTDCLLQFLFRMPFVEWQPPTQEVLSLQAITRRVMQLKETIVQEKNRLHAVKRMPSCKHIIQNDIQVNIRHLQRRITQLEQQGKVLLQTESWQLLISVTDIADISAMYLLAELLTLPPDMQAAQWVAYAGLDPRACESGTSIHKPRHISKAGNKFLRAALFLPALVTIRYQPNVKAFYDKLVAAGKKKMQAVVAVMRKLLHAVWGMLKHQQPFDGDKFYRLT